MHTYIDTYIHTRLKDKSQRKSARLSTKPALPNLEPGQKGNPEKKGGQVPGEGRGRQKLILAMIG